MAESTSTDKPDTDKSGTAAKAKKQTKPLGSVIEVEEGAVVRRPDDTEVTVSYGHYTLDAPGDHVIGDLTVTAK